MDIEQKCEELLKKYSFGLSNNQKKGVINLIMESDNGEYLREYNYRSVFEPIIIKHTLRCLGGNGLYDEILKSGQYTYLANGKKRIKNILSGTNNPKKCVVNLRKHESYIY